MSNDTERLEKIQRWMFEALAMPSSLNRQTLNETLLPGPQLDAASCLAIYQRSYILRLRKCLAEQFPATHHALGEALFNDFADLYLQACPSHSYTLYELGQRFPAWLEAARFDHDRPEHERESWVDFMVDLAHYERELFRLFDAPGNEGQPWPNRENADHELTLQPCLVLAQYRYGVAAYYHHVRDGQSPVFPPKSPAYFVILRRDYHTTTYPVSALHYRFLSVMQGQGSIARALVDIASWTQHSLETVTQSWTTEVRRHWIDAGFFVFNHNLNLVVMPLGR